METEKSVPVDEVSEEELQVRDDRGGNRSFFDNKIIKEYGWLVGANTIAVYLTLVMHADKRQKCFPSIERIAELLHLSKPTVIEDIKLLRLLNIIKTIRVGKMASNRYLLLDKINWRNDWKTLESEVNLLNFSGKTILLQRLNHLTSNSNNTHSNNTQRNKGGSKAPTKAFDFKEEMEKWGQDTYPRWMQILAFFFEEKKLVASTRPELDVLKKRHIKAAKELAVFDDTSKIKKAMEKCAKDERDGKYKWTLETIIKEITK